MFHPALVIGCGLAVVLVFTVIRRRRSRRLPQGLPPHVRDFLVAFTRGLDAHGARMVGFVPGRMTAIVSVEGQETPVPVHGLIEHWIAFPGDVVVLVQRLIQEIREEGLDDPWDVSFADAAVDLLPQIRTLDWVRQHGPAFGDGRLVYRALGADLAVCYVIDDSWSMVFVCEGHLRYWNRREEDLYSIACRNLLQRTAAPLVDRLHRAAPTLVRTGDGYAAARLLLLDRDAAAEDLLVALPDRDTLWVGAASLEGDGLESLMAQSAAECEQANRPVSPKVYRLAGGALSEAETR